MGGHGAAILEAVIGEKALVSFDQSAAYQRLGKLHGPESMQWVEFRQGKPLLGGQQAMGYDPCSYFIPEYLPWPIRLKSLLQPFC